MYIFVNLEALQHMRCCDQYSRTSDSHNKKKFTLEPRDYSGSKKYVYTLCRKSHVENVMWNTLQYSKTQGA
jgi:hypothetical protein